MFKKLFILIKVVVFIHLLFCLINGLWATTFVCLFNLLLFFVSDFIQKKFGYSNLFNLFIYLFLFGSLTLGEFYYLFVKVWYFDIIMHVLSSFIVSGLVVYALKFFRIDMNKIVMMFFIFSFTMMIAALWEITEFSIDRIFSSDMQKDTVISEINSTLLSDDGRSVVKKDINRMKIGNKVFNGYIDIGLYDTIEDLICAVGGSMIFIIISIFNIHNGNKYRCSI